MAHVLQGSARRGEGGTLAIETLSGMDSSAFHDNRAVMKACAIDTECRLRKDQSFSRKKLIT
jgi:hypothetical protein